jgi:glycosyltransferase involved in cell wall biosynthesis
MNEGSPPLVSVVIPTYDRPQYLKRAVESVLGQTYGNIELIVVDDCSSAPAEEILSDLFERDIRAIHVCHSENRGANAARNSGIEVATGEFIAFLDDDDYWKPTKLEQQLDVFERSPADIGVVCTGVQYINDEGELMAEVPILDGDVIEGVFTGSFPTTFSALMVRSSVVDEAGLPDERFPSWQDLEWCVRLSQHCRFEPVAQPLMVRRVGHEGRISEDFETKRDVSFPLLVSKHRSLIAERGPVHRRRTMASLFGMLGWAALKNEYCSDARKYLLKSIVRQPFSSERYPQLFAAIGGKYTYRSARRAVRLLRSIRAHL